MPQPTSPQVKSIIRAYIGLLMKYPENTYYSQLTLRHEMLPPDMAPNEGVILRGIFDLRSRVPIIPPTRDNIANWLAVSGKEPLISTVDSIVKEVDDEDQSGIPTYGAFVDAWMQNQSGMAASQRAAAIMSEPSPDYEEKYNRAAREFSKAIPKSATIQELTEDQLIELVVRENKATWKENQTTGDIGWGMPFQAYKYLFPRFKPREFTTLIAETGVGKTSMMMIMAEHHSWIQPIKTDSVIFELETDPYEIGQRQIGRHLKIPFVAIDSGNVLLDSDKWRPRVAEFSAKKNSRSNNSGHIQLIYCPGAIITQITLMMEGYAQASMAAGRRCAFWLDNLQRVNWTVYGIRQHEAYALIADSLSYVVRKYPNTHMFLIAQEYEDRVFGSTSIERMSQKMLSFRREKPEGGIKEDIPVMVRDASGKPVQEVDALGNKRFWQRSGDKRSGKGVIELLKTNSGKEGTIEVLFDGALNIMVQDPEQMKRLKGNKPL